MMTWRCIGTIEEIKERIYLNVGLSKGKVNCNVVS